MALPDTPTIAAHRAIGALNGSVNSAVIHAAVAASSADPYGTYADAALHNIAAAHEALNGLELALLALKADGEIARAA